jgi:diguanylate cyclase (GGDEF)-like protein/PAS domain S-box-containing protein
LLSATAEKSDGKILNAIIQDISQVTEELAESAIMKKALANIRDGLMITDERQIITDVNEALCSITGYSREELIGKTPRIFKSKEQGREFYQELWQHIRQTDYWEGRLWNKCRDGGLYAAYERISAIRNTNGELTHFISVITDVTESIEQKHRLENIAITDPLTGLANRAQMHEQLRTDMAQAHLTGSALAVCYIDIDNFRLVNERLGHTAGDELLILIASKIKTLINSKDSIARIGGDEFGVILNDLRDYRSCEDYADQILSSIRGTYTLSDEKKVYLSASMGVSLYPRDDSDPDSLLRHADQAMYQAKDHGRDRFAMFDIEKSRSEHVKRRQVQRIEYAIRDKEFVLHYQPQVNMRTGEITGAEALVRWQHPEDGLIFPDQFLPLVAGTDQAVAIDKWVISEAIQQITRFQRAGLQFPVSVNIDGEFLQRIDFVDYLSEQLTANPNVDPTMLDIEILESTALTDLDNVTQVIRTCQEMGVAVALDDFGTGYSSLTYLKQLPCDTLKIDKSFVIDMTDEPESKSLVEGIIGLARALGRKVVAEGVESEAHGRMLLAMGCECAQGYGIGRPIPPEALIEWVNSYTQPESWRGVTSNVYWLERGGKSLSS